MIPAEPLPLAGQLPLDYPPGGAPAISSRCRRAVRLLFALGLLCIVGSVGGVITVTVFLSINSDSSPEGMGAAVLVMIPLVMLLSLIPIAFGIIYLVCSRKILSGRRAWAGVALGMTTLQELLAVLSSCVNPFNLDPPGTPSWRAPFVAIWLISIAFSVILGFTIYYLIRILPEL